MINWDWKNYTLIGILIIVLFICFIVYPTWLFQPVDDTIHFLNQYQSERKSGKSIKEAAVSAIENKGVPMTTTSLILMGGFGILVLSSFVPTAQFGFLCSIIMLFALVSDLIILPAMLMLKK